MDLAKVVSTRKPPTTGPKPNGRWAQATASKPRRKYHVVAFDYGVKRNILRMLAERGCKVTVLPAQASRRRCAGAQPGRHLPVQRPRRPGAVRLRDRRHASELIERGIPTFGICLGHQIMALASGAKTLKMKFGHHGANHPVQDLDSKQVLITSQNHGFAVDRRLAAGQLPRHARVAVRRLAARFCPHRQTGVLLPGPPGSIARPDTISPICSIASWR